MQMENRSLEEALVDRFLLLYVVARTRKKGCNILGHIKLQKMLYKTQERMYLARWKGFNYNFVRWKFGPFSQEIYSDVDDLKRAGYLIQEDAASISEKGLRLLKDFDVLLDAETKDIIERVINEFGPYTGRQIREVMYSFPKVGEKKTIEEAEMGEVLLTRLHPEDAKKCLRADEAQLETLRFLLVPKSNKEIQDGLRSLRTDKCQP